jgi:flavin-dependent dehydrogenase
MKKMPQTIAIIGGGPAGASLGFLLARQGCKTAIFHSDKRPPLIVGESLIPAVIPFLRTLGIEAEVKSFSVYKPGATVCLNVNEVITAPFTFALGRLPEYAYNTRRDLFDQAVLGAAERAGAKIIRASAKLERGDATDTVKLSEATLAHVSEWFGGQPELIVDATGRNLAIAKLLGHPLIKGTRQDVAMFAHLDNAKITDPGHIHLDYLTKGWSWRIPLEGRISMGVVINPSHLEKYGSTVEQQYDAYIRDEPSLKVYSEGATRVSPVMKYNNYQQISERMYGPNWISVGDAAGFTDPVFSSGLYISLKSAFEAFDALSVGTPAALQKYQKERARDFRLWQQVIDSWYNGKLFNFYRAGQKYRKGFLGERINVRVRMRLARILTGEATSDGLTMFLFKYLMALGVVLRNPADLVIV